MDKQDTLKNLLMAAAVFFLIMALAPYLFPTRPAPPAAGAPGLAGQVAAPGVQDAATGDGGWSVTEADAPQDVTIGTEANPVAKDAPPSPYRMRVELSNRGAGVRRVHLADHFETPEKKDLYQLLHPIVRGEIEELSFVVEKININGVDVGVQQKLWQVQQPELYTADAGVMGSEGQKLSFSIDVLKDESPALRLTRSYYLPQQSEESGRHDLWADVVVENLASEPHRVVLTLRGAVGVSAGNGRYAVQSIDYGVLSGGTVLGARKTLAELHKAPGMRLPFYRYEADSAENRLSWTSIDNTYFTAIFAPLATDRQSPAAYLAEGAAYDVDGSSASNDDVATQFVTAAQELPVGGKLTFPAQLYLGDKNRSAFNRVPEYVARNYHYLLTAGVTWCTFSWLADLMTWILNGLYFVVRDFGVAIIILVVIVRALLHPLTKKGQINMVRMQKKAGELSAMIEEAKRKYGSDKARVQQETMRIYREVGVNPFGQMLTCMPMLIQMPIWVALFFSLSNNVLMRHQPVHLTWIKDLTAPDALIPFSSPLTIPLVGWQIASFNLLPILVAIFMYVQQKTQPRPEPNPNASEQQRQQQEMMMKMMPIMSIMMLFIFYNMPAGLNLYVMCSSLFGWLEQRHIRAHIKEREAAGTLHKPPKERGPKGPTEQRQLPGWLQKLQNAAEEAQKAQRTQRRDNKKPRR